MPKDVASKGQEPKAEMSGGSSVPEELPSEAAQIVEVIEGISSMQIGEVMEAIAQSQGVPSSTVKAQSAATVMRQIQGTAVEAGKGAVTNMQALAIAAVLGIMAGFRSR